MKLEKLVIANENGETGEISRADYLKHVLKAHDVKPMESEETGTTPADKVVTYVLKSVENGTEIDPAISAEYGDLIKAIEEDVKRTQGAKEDKKKEAEAAKAKKEADKKAAEEEAKKKAEALALTQAAFVEKVAAGAELAREEFGAELDTLKASLPSGAKIVQNGAGFGIEFDTSATQETIGETLGYVLQKAENSSFIGNQLYFWIGDTISVAVARGFYATAKEAAVHIAKIMSEKLGKAIQAPSLDQYKRMAERTPIEYRNPKAAPTAYLAVSAAKAPRKDEKETDEQFKKRLGEFNEEIAGIQRKLAVGEVTDRKEVLPLVNEVLIKHGMKKEQEGPQVSVTQYLAIYFHTSFAIEQLNSTHKQGLVIYKKGEELFEVPVSDLEEQRDAALAHLTNIFFTSEKLGLKPADYIRGYVEKTTKVKVADGQDGKPVMQDEIVKNLIYPVPFWDTEKKAEEAPSAIEQVAAEAPAEATTKKGKK